MANMKGLKPADDHPRSHANFSHFSGTARFQNSSKYAWNGSYRDHSPATVKHMCGASHPRRDMKYPFLSILYLAMMQLYSSRKIRRNAGNESYSRTSRQLCSVISAEK